MARDASKFHKENIETSTVGKQQNLSMRFSPRHHRSTNSPIQSWKPPPYAQLESQIETQDEDDKETQLFQTVEQDESGISNLDDIDSTQSQ